MINQSIPLILKERFKILKEVGRGGFGNVYKAKNKKNKKNFAIKQIKLKS